MDELERVKVEPLKGRRGSREDRGEKKRKGRSTMAYRGERKGGGEIAQSEKKEKSRKDNRALGEAKK